MKVKVLFFGATADAVGKREAFLELNGAANIAAVSELILNSYPELQERNLLFAVNEEYAQLHTVLNDGDEIAIFTPVSGG